MTKHTVALHDRYTETQGDVLLTSMQALVRLPLDQSRCDRRDERNTAGFVTGYRGSPITTLDAQLWAARSLLEQHDVHFEPGLNEELAATSLRGTQQLDWFGPARVEGVYAMWYAKGLGVDRAIEALKIANFEGTHPRGGVLIHAGDDPAAKSSATAHQSEQALISAMIPVLAPSTTEEILHFGLAGWALSRACGLYTALKHVTDTLDLTSTVRPGAPRFVVPSEIAASALGLLRGRSALDQEKLTVAERLPAATLFARANRLDQITTPGGSRPRLTILAAGRAWLEVREALSQLGIDTARAETLGIRVAKVGLVWPCDEEFLQNACAGSKAVLVVEEKRAVIEAQLASALYGIRGARPLILGKSDDRGAALLPSFGVLTVQLIRAAIERAARAAGINGMIGPRADEPLLLPVETVVRPAYFCSGCPHNTSTNLPDGSIALGATGCHGLAVGMPERRTMTFVGMGAEGTPWIGAHRFSSTEHVFVNMGDGTFTHSGLLAIRAACAAKARMTYKILYNDAVAMTGGQPLEGAMSPARIVQELLAEGVSPVVVVSDQPDRAKTGMPRGIRVTHRDRLPAIQRELREVGGVSAIVYVQTCATELRRRRNRGEEIEPGSRLFINSDVCEGCGDCSVQSNCVSLVPLETEFGRKRAIDQSTCNKDFSCIKGFCPSFVTVRGAAPRWPAQPAETIAAWADKLPEAGTVPVDRPLRIVLTGIGGTGVLTISALLGMAARMEGLACRILDMTGMAQKGGGVSSHLQFATRDDDLAAARIDTDCADVLIACDLIVAAGAEIRGLISRRTRVILNDDVVPTGQFQQDRDQNLNPDRFIGMIVARLGESAPQRLSAQRLATKLIGDAVFSNMVMLGYCAQSGCLPVGTGAIEDAIRLNNVAVERNLRAFALGRIQCAFPEAIAEFVGTEPGSKRPATSEAMVKSWHGRLVDYQDEAYADDYERFMHSVRDRLRSNEIRDPEFFLIVVADQLGRLMAYKDEYEVARLYSSPKFRRALERQFERGRIRIALAPPLLALRKDARTGNPAKIEFGGWILPLFGLLARLKFLRRSRLDPFGWTHERRTERKVILEYRELIERVLERISGANLDLAASVARTAEAVVGYGPVKDRGITVFRKNAARLLAELERAGR